MAKITRKCWLTFEGGRQNEPCLWRMTRKYPEVVFDIRQASVQKDIGVMAVLFDGDEGQDRRGAAGGRRIRVHTPRIRPGAEYCPERAASGLS